MRKLDEFPLRRFNLRNYNLRNYYSYLPGTAQELFGFSGKLRRD